MRRQAWGATDALSTPQRANATPSEQTLLLQSAGSVHEAGAVPGQSKEPTPRILVHDLDSSIPAADLEQGLLGLFSVFGPVPRVSCLSGGPALPRDTPSLSPPSAPPHPLRLCNCCSFRQ